MSELYLSSIILNANVPSGVPITPNQAWVNAAAAVAASEAGGSNALLFSNMGITSVASGYVQGKVSIAPNYCEVNFLNNAIASASNVNAILAEAAASGMNNGTLNISGGTNAVPTPAQVHVDEIYTLTFPDAPAGGGGGSVYFQVSYFLGGSGGFYRIYFDNTIPFSSSNLYDGFVVGCSDAPTGVQIATWVASVFSGYVPGVAVDNGDGTMTVTDSTDSNYPYFFSDFGSGIYAVENQAGQAFIPNASITALIAASNTVTTN